MIIGCPTEIKNQEYRVGITPAAAAEAILHGHKVLIQSGAGNGSGFTDNEYTDIGAVIIDAAEELFKKSEMIVKVKEPQAIERLMLREDQILFTYLHLAPDLAQTNDLLKSGVTAIAYETVTDGSGGLPLLAPMSEVAGKLAPQVGSWALQKANGGLGTLLGAPAQAPGVRPGRAPTARSTHRHQRPRPEGRHTRTTRTCPGGLHICLPAARLRPSQSEPFVV